MQMRWKLAAAASAVALAVSMAVAFAGPAGASDDQVLCAIPDNNTVYAIQCIYNVNGSVETNNAGDDHWNTPGRSGQISSTLAPGNCLEISGSANKVILAPCSGYATEEWTAYNSGEDFTVYRSETGMCLNDQYYDYDVTAVSCPVPDFADEINSDWLWFPITDP
jgi:hypothetical protein